MKAASFLKVMLLTMPFLFVGCKSKKAVVEPPKPVTVEMQQQQNCLLKVNDNAQYEKFITSKVKFVAASGGKDISLTGNLKMKLRKQFHFY